MYVNGRRGVNFQGEKPALGFRFSNDLKQGAALILMARDSLCVNAIKVRGTLVVESLQYIHYLPHRCGGERGGEGYASMVSVIGNDAFEDSLT